MLWGDGLILSGSLSARRAWIEMTTFHDDYLKLAVALRKESVDRNKKLMTKLLSDTGRSPQGERG